MKNTKAFIILLIVFEFFNGLSGLAGGFGLIGDPTSASLGMKLEWLNGTPFSNYLIPGIVLFIINGIGNTTAAIMSIKKTRYFDYLGTLMGTIMMIWIISQVAWIGYKNFLQPLYFSTGLIQTVLGIIVVKAKISDHD